MKHKSFLKRTTMLLFPLWLSGTTNAQDTNIPSVTATPAYGRSYTQSILPPSSKIAHKLLQLQQITTRNANWKTSTDTAAFSTLNIIQNKVRVIIEADNGTDMSAFQSVLQKNGLSDLSVYQNMVGGYIDIAQLSNLEGIAPLRYVHPASKAIRRSGNALSQADKAARADIARRLYKVNGKGVKIGLLSDSYDAYGEAALGVRTGELPGIDNPNGFTKPVVVLKDYNSPYAIDEGRALAEVVHDIAPGAELYYYTGYIDQVDFAAGIEKLANAGCKVIVDDVAYFEEPFFQDGIVNQAITKVKNKGVTYVTACGNSGSVGYEKNFKGVSGKYNGASVVYHNFSSDNSRPNIALTFTLPAFFVTNMVLQWDEPFYATNRGGAKSDYDLMLTVTDSTGTTSFIDDANNIGGSPYSFVGLFNSSPQPITINLYVMRKAGSPAARFIKIVDMTGGAVFLPGETTQGINAGTVVGHSNSNDAISVGSAYYRKTQMFGAVKDSVQRYSARGNTKILFTTDGRPGTQERLKPDIVAADGANTSFFGFDYDGDGYPNFAGTSAAAPVVGAIAALAIEASKCAGTIPPDLMKMVMQRSANDMDDPATTGFDKGYDKATGYGFLRADDVVRTFTGACSSPHQPIAILPIIIHLFPNPVQNILQIIFGIPSSGNSRATYSILNSAGQQVLGGTLNTTKAKAEIDVKSLRPGNYYLRIEQEGKISVVQPFIKQ